MWRANTLSRRSIFPCTTQYTVSWLLTSRRFMYNTLVREYECLRSITTLTTHSYGLSERTQQKHRTCQSSFTAGVKLQASERRILCHRVINYNIGHCSCPSRPDRFNHWHCPIWTPIYILGFNFTPQGPDPRAWIKLSPCRILNGDFPLKRTI